MCFHASSPANTSLHARFFHYHTDLLFTKFVLILQQEKLELMLYGEMHCNQ